MFDLTRLARTIGFVFLAYLGCVPVGAIVLAIVGFSTGKSGNLDFLWRGVVWVFPVLAIVLAVDFHRRLRSGRLTVTQVPGYRFVGVLTTFGAAWGLNADVWIPVVISLPFLIALCVPTRRKAAPSTWVAKGPPAPSLRRKQPR
jgi:hypothetical protein